MPRMPSRSSSSWRNWAVEEDHHATLPLRLPASPAATKSPAGRSWAAWASSTSASTTRSSAPSRSRPSGPSSCPTAPRRDRFLQEGETWVRLGKHPHIVRCYQVFQDTPRPEVYLALELIAKEEGRRDASLRAWLTPGQPLPVGAGAAHRPADRPRHGPRRRDHPRLRPPRPQAGERAGGRRPAEQRGDQPRAGHRLRAGQGPAGRAGGGGGRSRSLDRGLAA